MNTIHEKPANYDFWSASARRAYDEMETRALTAEEKLDKVRKSLNTGIDTNTIHDTLSWDAAMMQLLDTMLAEAAESLDPNRIFQVATRHIGQFLDVSSVYICDWNLQLKQTSVLADYIAEKATDKERIPDVGAVYQLDSEFEQLMDMVENYRVAHYDAGDLSYSGAGTYYQEQGVKTAIFAPVYAGEELIGYVEAWDTSRQREFTVNQTDFITFVASKIAHSLRVAQLHRALLDSEQRYSTLMDTIESGVAQTDMEGNIQFVNRHFSEMLDMSPDQLLQQNLENLWQQRAEPSEIPGEYHLLKPDGDSIWLQVVNAPIPGKNGKPIGEAVVYTDITRRRETEQLQIRMALENERINLLARFINDISHEFYTPLSVINTRSFMLRKYNDASELTKGLDVIEAQTDSITRLIKALVDMTKLDATDSLSLQNYNISLLVNQIVTKYQSRVMNQGKHLHFESGGEQIYALVDVAYLGMAVSEVVKNALNYTTPCGGSINLSVQRQDETVQIIVEDTGLGMTNEAQKSMFERFYRADESHSTRGLGLGLSIVKRIVDLHSGNITVKSKLGEGTHITISLPS